MITYDDDDSNPLYVFMSHIYFCVVLRTYVANVQMVSRTMVFGRTGKCKQATLSRVQNFRCFDAAIFCSYGKIQMNKYCSVITVVQSFCCLMYFFFANIIEVSFYE